MAQLLESSASRVESKLGYSIFDAEIHCNPPNRREVAKFLPTRYRRRYLEHYLGDPKPNLDQRGGNNRHDVDVSDGGPAASNPVLIRRQLLEPYSIEWCICTGVHYNLSVLADLDYATAVAAAYNDWLIGEFVPSDPAFLGAISVSLSDPAAAVAEIERWAGHPRVVEVFISTAGLHPLGHRFHHPVYEAAAAHDLPVAAHTTVEGRGISGSPTGVGYPSKYLEFHTALAASAITNCASLVCGGAFAKIPNFKFLLLEGGISWVQPLMWMLDADWRRLREEMPSLLELPSDYLKRQMFYTTQPIEEPSSPRDLIQTYEAIGGKTQIVFSSDYPHWDFDNPFTIMPGQTAAELKRRVLRENALALYGPRLPEGALA